MKPEPRIGYRSARARPGASESHGNGWDYGLKVADDGTGLVGHGGGVLLRKLADQCGLGWAIRRMPR